MTNIDKHAEENYVHAPPTEDKYFQSAARLPEKIIVAIIILVGICGLLYLSNVLFQRSPTTSFSSSPNSEAINLYPAYTSASKAGKAEAHRLTFADSRLLIKGERVAGGMLSFQIQNFQDEVTYQLVLDGDIYLDIAGPVFHYSFYKAGTHHLKLIASFKDESLVLEMQDIYIARPRMFS